MKKFIQKIFNFFGYKVINNKSLEKNRLDEYTNTLIQKSNPIIFDVGANKGQSIKRYKNIFQNPIIHSFEPNIEELNNLQEYYNEDKSLYLNNLALGEKKEILEFNINAISGHSSFKNIVPNTTWVKKRSKIVETKSKDYTKKKIAANVVTLDDYVLKNNIENIDILKIDTQGFEDKVLLGAQKTLKENKIKLIQLELIFSEVYENPLQIYDVEKTLIPNNYKLFCISNSGSLISHYLYQSEFIYVSLDTYKKFKINSPFFNN